MVSVAFTDVGAPSAPVAPVAPSVSAGPPTAAALEQAASQFQAAHRAFDGGDYESARVHYEAAFRLVPHPSTQYNLALTCERALRPGLNARTRSVPIEPSFPPGFAAENASLSSRSSGRGGRGGSGALGALATGGLGAATAAGFGGGTLAAAEGGAGGTGGGATAGMGGGGAAARGWASPLIAPDSAPLPRLSVVLRTTAAGGAGTSCSSARQKSAADA